MTVVDRASPFENMMRQNIVAAAHALYRSKAGFATFYYSRCNEKYWILTGEGGFKLRAGVKSSEAIRDIFVNGEQYAFECATAMMIVLYKALIETISSERFDMLYHQLYLWDWEKHPEFPVYTEHITGNGLLGDVRYFKNPDVNPKTPQWQGENAVQLPNGQYFGHGIGILTGEGIIEELNKNRFPGAERSAYLMQTATRPDFDYLYALSNSRTIYYGGASH
ncbi:protein-glutamine gamma-glutamyltransferase [Scopulibacillus darangshiensis]|uniref:Protein-glutamine gamma-glutamyltransferase n=1 Tax=Scopulibacillus darangshiensis TaxID=442528 RepID=A0A4R2P0A4_9BACL|nr:protein-glutamine gamma-glutamyltransferase [Scopulibacillus darangshiensis]TCP27055.1 protein-glutamine gamma-glutamyltransferase [Scopulibacillus darangshiensis]